MSGLIFDIIVGLGTIHLFWLCAQLLFGFIKSNTKPIHTGNSSSTDELLILIPACNESPRLIDQTIRAAKKISNSKCILIENSTQASIKSSVEELCAQLQIKCYSIPNLGNKARALNHYFDNNPVEEKYLAVFDADQVPSPDFFSQLEPYFRADEDLALVQSPQVFKNKNKNAVTFTYTAMQEIFFRAICVARNSLGFTPCLGTNFIMTIEAAKSIGYFDETSQTEDVATSLKLALAGYASYYHNKRLAVGLIPSSFIEVLKQMKRYTIGSNQILGKIIFGQLWRFSNWRKSFTRMALLHYWHYSSTLLLGSLVFLASFFSQSSLVEVNLVLIGVNFLLLFKWISIRDLFAGTLLFTLLLPFTLIFNLDLTAYNHRFVVSKKPEKDLLETPVDESNDF